MNLTERKGNKYFAMAQADEIIKKLNRIEEEAPVLLANLCDRYCMYPEVAVSQEQLTEKCEACPMKALMEMIE